MWGDGGKELPTISIEAGEPITSRGGGEGALGEGVMDATAMLCLLANLKPSPPPCPLPPLRA